MTDVPTPPAAGPPGSAPPGSAPPGSAPPADARTAAELRAACATIRGVFGAAAVSCALATEDGGALTFAAADGAGAEEIVGVSLPVSRGIVGFVALAGQPIAVGDVAADRRFARDIAESTNYVPQTILAAPLLDDEGETIGVVEVLDPVRPDGDSRIGGQRGTVAELAVLTLVASQLATVVRLGRLAARGQQQLDAELLAAVARVSDSGPAGSRLARDVLAAVSSYTGDGGPA